MKLTLPRFAVRPALELAWAAPFLRKPIWKLLYSQYADDWLFEKLPAVYLRFLNYGYVSLDREGPVFELEEGDEPSRHQMQLYGHLAEGLTIEGRSVLDVGCGRGGGVYFFAKYMRPRRAVGLDMTPSHVDAARKLSAHERASYVEGDACAMPFASGEFDVVVNVESSHCYPSRDRFYAESNRVLSDGGHLLHVDMFKATEIASKDIQRRIERAGFTIEREEDLTKNVLAARQQKEQLEREWFAKLPPEHEKIFRDWACHKGSVVHESLAKGEQLYYAIIGEKRARPR